MQSMDASPSSPFEIDIDSLHCSIMSFWSMLAHIALANNSASLELIFWSAAIALRLKFRMWLENSVGNVILSDTVKLSPMSILILLIFDNSGYLEHGVPLGASQPISSSHWSIIPSPSSSSSRLSGTESPSKSAPGWLKPSGIDSLR